MADDKKTAHEALACMNRNDMVGARKILERMAGVRGEEARPNAAAPGQRPTNQPAPEKKD